MKYFYSTALLLLICMSTLFAQNEGQITVMGSCGMCADRIIETASNVAGIETVKYNLSNNLLSFTYSGSDFDVGNLHEAMVAAGHDTDKLKASDTVYNALPLCCYYRTVEKHGDMQERSVVKERKKQKASNADFKRNPILTGSIYELGSDNDSISLIGANLQWEGAQIGAVTNEDGFFEIGRISSTDNLIISYVGYNSDTLDVSGTNQLSWVLSDGVRLDDVEVVFRTKSTSISFINPIQVTEMNEAELCKAACCSLSESFETNPAVDASFTDAVSGTRQIQMLGLAGKYVQITTELIPDIRSTSVIDGLDYIPGAWIESIQLSKGTGSVAQGYESMTGQINVELRKPERPERFYLNLYGNEGGRYEGNLTVKHKFNNNFSTALLLHGKSQFQRHDRNKDGFLDMPLGQNFYIQNRWKFQQTDGWQSSLSVKHVQQEAVAGQFTFQEGISDRGETWGFTKDVERSEAWLKVGRYINPITESSFGFQVSLKQYQDNRTFGLTDMNVDEINFFSNFLYEQNISGKAHKMKVGASFIVDDYREVVESMDFDFREEVAGAFSEYTFKPNTQFTAVVGARIDHHNYHGWRFTPRMHLRYALHEHTVFRLTAGKGWRTTRLISEHVGFLASNRELIITPSESNTPYGLLPEENWNFGANITQTFNVGQREGVISLDYYHTRFQNQIVPDLENATVGTVNLYNQEDKTIAHSAQFQLDYELIKNLDVRLAYRYNISRAILSGEEKTIPLSPFHRAFINLEYEAKKGWFFDLTVQWTGEQRLPNTNWLTTETPLDEFSDDFVMVMAQVRRVFNENFEFYVGGENIFDFRLDNPILGARDPFGPDFDASLVWGPIFGRNIYAGLRYRFD